MNNATIERNYRVFYDLADSDEAVEAFGQYYLDDYGYKLPVDLIERYKAAQETWKAVQRELKAIYEDMTGQYRNAKADW